MALTEMSIEIDTRCNARCFYCDTGNKSRAPHRKWMETDQFKRIVDHALSIDLIDTNSLIYLFDRGEPTLHPAISDIIRELDARGLGYCISTNCGLVPRLDDHVSMAGLRKFVISMPGFSQESYDRIHQIPFDNVIQNIKFMLSDFKRRGFIGETIMSLHVYRFNVAELEPASAFCRANGITFGPYYAFFADGVWRLDFLTGKLSDNVLVRAKDELFLDKIIEQSKKTPAKFRCPQYDKITINENGELVLCIGAPRLGNEYYDGYLLGDFMEMTAEQIMHRKTTSRACTRCLSSGAAYLGHIVMRPDEFLPREKPRDITSAVQPLSAQLIARAERQSVAGENASVQIDENGLRLAETPAYGYHRLLGRIDGGRAGQPSILSLLAKPAGRSRVKMEVHDDGAKNYVSACFDLMHGCQIAADGPIAQVEIDAADDGYYRLSLGLTPECDTQIHYSVTLMNADNGIVYSGRDGEALLLRQIDIAPYIRF